MDVSMIVHLCALSPLLFGILARELQLCFASVWNLWFCMFALLEFAEGSALIADRKQSRGVWILRKTVVCVYLAFVLGFSEPIKQLLAPCVALCWIENLCRSLLSLAAARKSWMPRLAVTFKTFRGMWSMGRTVRSTFHKMFLGKLWPHFEGFSWRKGSRCFALLACQSAIWVWGSESISFVCLSACLKRLMRWTLFVPFLSNTLSHENKCITRSLSPSQAWWFGHIMSHNIISPNLLHSWWICDRLKNMFFDEKLVLSEEAIWGMARLHQLWARKIS